MEGFSDAIDVIDDWLDLRFRRELFVCFLSIELSWQLLFIALFIDDLRLWVKSSLSILVLDDLDCFILFCDY